LEELDATANDTGDLTRIVDIVESSVDALTNFRSRKAKHLAGWWMAAHGGRMPTRAMFDIVDHRPVVANLFLVEVLPDGEFLFKVLGEDVVQIIGRNRTGETVSRLNASEYGHELHDYYQSIVTGRACRKCTGSLEFSIGGMRGFESVDCPLADDRGEKVVAIIGLMDVVR
jgi:hypothetical protein